MGKFEKRIEFRRAYDKRDPDPSKNYGIHGVDMFFFLVKDNKAIQFLLSTGWHLPHVRDELRSKGRRSDPLPADLGYHSPTPMYEGQDKMTDDCHVIDGVCYYDGSGLQAESVFELLLRAGSDAVWERLEEEWHRRFDETKGD